VIGKIPEVDGGAVETGEISHPAVYVVGLAEGVIVDSGAGMDGDMSCVRRRSIL